MRILKDAIQTILPPTIAIVAFVISPEFLEAKYKFAIMVSLLLSGFWWNNIWIFMLCFHNPLYNMYGLKSAAFVIYTTSFGTLLLGIIWSLFQKNKHSYGYTIRTLLIGIISYYSTTDHLQMNETSITVSLVSASITLSFAISELHKLNESFIFKLDRLELKNGCYYIPDKLLFVIKNLENLKIELIK
ncbi:unnamed protein product [Rhizophagus irregularis]|nr:unnamed protein product [Rhizophagus irregularis]